MYGYHPYTLADRLLPLTDSTADAADRLTLFADIRDVVNQLLNIKLSKERMTV
jgi:hypothetical protein